MKKQQLYEKAVDASGIILSPSKRSEPGKIFAKIVFIIFNLVLFYVVFKNRF